MISGQTIRLWLNPGGITALDGFGLPPQFSALLYREETSGLWLVPGDRSGRLPLVWIKKDYVAAIESPVPPRPIVREKLGFIPGKGN